MAIAVAVVAAVVFSAGQDLPRREVRSRAATTSSGRTPASGPASTSGSRASSRTSRTPTARWVARSASTTGRLTGDVSCVGGGSDEPIDARRRRRVRSRARSAAAPLQAALTRDPPPPGPRPRAPDSIAGDYVLKPRSRLPRREDGDRGLRARVRARARRDRRSGTRPLRGGPADGRGGTAPTAPPSRSRAGPPTARSRCTVGEAQVTAEKQREAGSRFAAFFIAVAVVMLRRAAVRDGWRCGSASRA